MADDERSSDDAGWAAPHLPPADPAGGDAPAPEDATPAATPPPPAPPPPSAAWAQPPAGAPPRKRRGWIIALVAGLGVIVLAGVLGTVFFVSNTLPPYNASNDFIDDIRQGRFDAAADQLCRADQDNPDDALSVVTRTFPGHDEIAVNPLSVSVDGDTATVEFTVTADNDDTGDGDTFELPLRKEGDDWKPCPGAGLR
jgi:hypothetical protein